MRILFNVSFLIMVGVSFIPTLSHAGAQVNAPGVSVGVDTFPDDRWYGPGYYYGNWYDEEKAYWAWRRRYYYYPSNRDYYSPNKPIYYYPDRNERDYREDDRRDDRNDDRWDDDEGHYDDRQGRRGDDEDR